MAVLTALAIGAGIASGVGSLISTAYSHYNNKKTKQYNTAEAQKTRDWETEMSNTSYQRATADMKAAGLNPALMYGNGADGASTPSATAASVNANGGVPLELELNLQTLQAGANLMSSAAQVIQANKNPNSRTYQSAASIISSVEKLVK